MPVLLHMFAGSARSWDPVLALLGQHCVVPDLRGFGGAPPPAPGARLDDWVDQVAEAVAPLGRFMLVGHSMGGKIAMALAARRPAGLARLVLVAPSPPTPEPIPDRAAMLVAYGDPAAAAETARHISIRAADPAVLQGLVDDSLRTSWAGWDWWIRHGSLDDISRAVGAIDVPTDVLAGDKDSTLPAALLVREVVARIAGAALRTVPGSRHMMPIDQPGALAEHVASCAAL